MPLRIATLLILLFWLGSVAWLCAVVWAPPSSRMALTDPREVYRVFFGWNESTTMALLDNGRRRGEIKVSGSTGHHEQDGVVERVLSVSGVTDRLMEDGSTAIQVSWRGSIAFTEEMRVRDGEVSLRVPGRELTAHLAYDARQGEGTGFQARVDMAGQEIFAVDSLSGLQPTALALPLLGQASELAGVAGATLGSLKFTVEARTGNFLLAGREIPAFVLILRGEEAGQELRAYISEAGEPLRIETDFGIEAVSEILVPLSAYKRSPSS